MARKQRAQPQQSGPGGARRRGRFSDRFRPRKYTRINVENIDYKDLATLRRFISDRGKIRSRRVTGLSRRHQQQLNLAVRRARELAMLPYVGER
jgi:small subunit ribosomal protein S18